MKLTAALFVLASAYASLSSAQSTTATSDIFTIQPVTSILPSSVVSSLSRASTRSVGGSQIEPSSFTTSRRTISDASTDRPTLTGSGTLTGINPLPSATATLPGSPLPSASSASVISSASSAAASATTSPNAASKSAIGSIGTLGALAALAGAILA
ncbi:hypothetical protein BDV93DRAFT_518412 [Ceratobasidium sp. AG-I]|nr:hypothetical protein BDV93DRAFT_518412 [Ceratobasidium sp. AG-I]